MKVNLGVFCHNSKDWDRVLSGDYNRPPDTPDYASLQRALALGDLAEPLGFDGIWAPQHFGTPYGMTPNPFQALAYFAGRTKNVSLGTMVAVVPWWHPVHLAHEIAYLDVISNGRLNTIGLGRGLAKSEFDALGIPREESRQRFNEGLEVLQLALSQERFSYKGNIFKIPEMSIRPSPKSHDLFSRIHGSAGSRESLEVLSRRGLAPLFVGNKPAAEAGKDIQFTNTIRQEIGLPPCQPKSVLMMYCTATTEEARKAEPWIRAADRDATVHYGFADPSNYAGVKGYEHYAERASAAVAVLAGAAAEHQPDSTTPRTSAHWQELLIGTPDEIIRRTIVAQNACSFCEVTILPQFGTMPYDEAEKSTKLFAKEVLPAIKGMDTPIHNAALPNPA